MSNNNNNPNCLTLRSIDSNVVPPSTDHAIRIDLTKSVANFLNVPLVDPPLITTAEFYLINNTIDPISLSQNLVIVGDNNFSVTNINGIILQPGTSILIKITLLNKIAEGTAKSFLLQFTGSNGYGSTSKTFTINTSSIGAPIVIDHTVVLISTLNTIDFTNIPYTGIPTASQLDFYITNDSADPVSLHNSTLQLISVSDGQVKFNVEDVTGIVLLPGANRQIRVTFEAPIAQGVSESFTFSISGTNGYGTANINITVNTSVDLYVEPLIPTFNFVNFLVEAEYSVPDDSVFFRLSTNSIHSVYDLSTNCEMQFFIGNAIIHTLYAPLLQNSDLNVQQYPFGDVPWIDTYSVRVDLLIGGVVIGSNEVQVIAPVKPAPLTAITYNKFVGIYAFGIDNEGPMIDFYGWVLDNKSIRASSPTTNLVPADPLNVHSANILELPGGLYVIKVRGAGFYAPPVGTPSGHSLKYNGVDIGFSSQSSTMLISNPFTLIKALSQYDVNTGIILPNEHYHILEVTLGTGV